jgi:hypothetical protein
MTVMPRGQASAAATTRNWHQPARTLPYSHNRASATPYFSTSACCAPVRPADFHGRPGSEQGKVAGLVAVHLMVLQATVASSSSQGLGLFDGDPAGQHSLRMLAEGVAVALVQRPDGGHVGRGLDDLFQGVPGVLRAVAVMAMDVQNRRC